MPIKKFNQFKLKKIINDFHIKEGDNIYLSIDLMRLALTVNFHYKDLDKFSNLILNLFINKIGKSGNIIIPVFNQKSISSKFFNRKKSPGESGAFGNFLLKKNYRNRSRHPYVSFLCFGNDLINFTKIKNQNSEGLNSPWSYMIKKKFDLITIGHHFQKAFSIIHYLERMAKVNYRYDKFFTVNYTDFNGITEKRRYSFFARKLDICNYSSITTYCYDYFIKKNITQKKKFEKLISYKTNLKEACNVILKDLKLGSKKFISYSGNTKFDKKILYGKNVIW
jgi:aminoglycoside N3'-acetyltransferase